MVRMMWLVLAVLPASAITLISVADEIKLGREAQKQVRASTPQVQGSTASYVSSLGRQLAARAGGPKYPYGFSVANYRDLNAFALPGGPVWVHRGVLQAARNESQLAGVLAHEIAHVARRHAAQQISKGMIANGLLGLLGAVLGNTGGARTAQTGAQVIAGGYLMKFSRDDERDADKAGVDILRRAGWDPRGLLEFMEILREQGGRDPSSVEVFLSTHPSPAERVQQLRAQLARVKRGGRRDSAAFQRVRATLGRMPPAPRMPR
ncbi:MAG TPA: M48 family metallopeptidase [Vicinamibacterales bacterium]|nr:M48 family metallopeptidase [Vicinamibacterales bacterium]